VVNALRAVSDNLKELNLGTYVSQDPFGQGVSLEMTRLTTLRIRDWDWARYLRAPAIEQLALGNAYSPDGDSFDDIVCPFVTTYHLALFASCGVVEAQALTKLINITTLEICAPTWADGDSFGTLSDGFFSTAVNSETPVWPKLKHIHFATGFDSLAPVSDTGLVTFLRSRNEKPAIDLEGTSVSRIETVKLGYKAPEWLIQETERLTALH